MSRGILVSCLALSLVVNIILFQRIRNLSDKVLSLRQEVIVTKGEMSAAKDRVANTLGVTPTQSAAQKAGVEKSTDLNSPKETEIKNDNFKRSQWRANYLLRQVSDKIALSTAETKQLLDKFQEGGSLEDLYSVIGEERSSKFRNAQERALLEQEEEAIEGTTHRLTMKLNLSAEQEAILRASLVSIRETQRPKYQTIKEQSDRATALHTEENSGTELRKIYEQLRSGLQEAKEQETQLLLENLKDVLTEEQLAQLARENSLDN